MQAVREKQTGKVLYLFDDCHIVRITQHGMRSPLRALDIRPETHEVVKDVPKPELFVGGAMAYDGAWLVIDQECYDLAKEAQRQQQAQADREQRRAEIVAEYRSHPPVEVFGILWTGGDGSAAAIAGAVDLAITAGEETVTLWDASNTNHEGFSFQDAQHIAAEIALAYRARMFERNRRLAELA